MLVLRYISYLGLTIRLAEPTIQGILKWDKKSSTLKLAQNGKLAGARRRLNLQCFLTIAVLGIFLLQHHHKSSICADTGRNCSSFFDELVWAWCVILLSAGLSFLTIFKYHESAIATYMEGHLHLCRHLKHHFNSDQHCCLSGAERLNVLLAYFVFPSVLASPILIVSGLHWLSPCKASLLGYWLLDECTEPGKHEPSHLEYKSVLLKLAVFLANQAVHAWIMNVMPLVYAGMLNFCTISFRVYVSEIQRICLPDPTRFTTAGIAIYRRVQVLGILMNEIQRTGVTGVGILAAMLTQAVSAAGMCRITWTAQNWLPISVFAWIFFMGVSYSVSILGIQANVFATSEAVLKNLRSGVGRNGCSRRNQNLFRTTIRSCPALRVGFGGDNFLDKLTPLVNIDQANNLTINMLLLQQ